MSDFAYRILLFLFPTPFRREYGGEMLRLFRERSATFRSRGRGSYARFVIAAFRDLLVHGFLESTARVAGTFRGILAVARPRRRTRMNSSDRSFTLMYLIQDFRHAFRNLVRRPAFALIVVMTMTVGIGGNAAIFSVLNTVLLDGLPFREPGRIVMIDSRAYTGFGVSTSIPNYRDWRARNRSFSTYGASAPWSLTYTGGSRTQVLSGHLILGEFFETLGVDALLGRTIAARETDVGAEPLAVLGNRFWQREFGGDSSVIGRAITLDGQSATIIGVMPATFEYDVPETEVFLAMGTRATLPWEDRDSSFGTRAIARLMPGVTLEAAIADLERVGNAVRAEYGPTTATPVVAKLTDRFLGDISVLLYVLMGAVGLVLLIAIANVGNLLLVRGEGRRAELAVRTALGASRRTVLRHLVAEGLVLSSFGGLGGVVLAWLIMPALVAILPADAVPLAVIDRIGIDVPVLLFVAALVVVCGLFFGALPAFRLSGPSALEQLRSLNRSTDARGKRIRAVIVVMEVAVATVLLVGASLMVQTLARLGATDKGFEEHGVLTVRLQRQFPDSASWRSFYGNLEERMNAMPGVESAAISLLLPLTRRSWERRIWPEGVPADPETGQSVLYHVVSNQYFETLGIPIVAGRAFTPEDRGGSLRVAIIDETMAERFWPGENPIGKRVTLELDPTSTPDNPVRLYRTVVGVSRNVRHYELDNASRIQVLIPFMQRGCCLSMYAALKTGGETSSLAGPIQRLIEELDPEVAVSDVRTLQEYVAADMSSRRAVGNILVVFGVVALLLAGIGVFGVISYSVSRQTREIGLRIALGARGGDLIRWLARSGFGIGALGALIGAGLALGLARTLSSFLYEISPVQPLAYAVVALFMIALSAAASYLPARRAMQVDPVTALKQE